MKRIDGTILIAAACMMGTMWAPAQPPPGDASPPVAQDGPNGDMPGPGRNRLVERWLQFLEREQPEEFAEMTRLREEDPEEFQRRMRSRRDRLRMRSLQDAVGAVPRLNDFLEGLPPEERQELLGELDRKLIAHLERNIASQLGRAGESERHGPGPRRQHGNAKIRDLNQEIDAMARDYREADVAQQKRIKREIRGKLEMAFDLAESNRQEQIRRAEERLGSLKETLQTRAGCREDIIAQRLEELTRPSMGKPVQ